MKWFEELNPDYWIQLHIQEKGDAVYNENSILRFNLKLKNISTYIKKHEDYNIWRTRLIYRDEHMLDQIGLVPPLFFDVDVFDGPDESDPPNLENVYSLTLNCIEILSDEFSSTNLLRIIFSGRKGFHIEFEFNSPFEAESLQKNLIEKLNHRGIKSNKNCFYENTAVLDTIKNFDWIRLTGTLYSWYAGHNKLCIRRTFPMSLDEFRLLKLDGILNRANIS